MFPDMKKYRVAAVSYLNTKPLLNGLLQYGLGDQIDLQLAIPSVCAQLLKQEKVDFALVPVAIIPELDHYHLLSDYCIGTVGTVKTVCIFSEVPLQQVDTLLLDYHSRTSVALTQVLLQKHWNLSPNLVHATSGYESQIKGKTAGLIIGDRTIGLHDQYPYVYDLGESWEAYTGLPFVFAAWVSKGKIDDLFQAQMNIALRKGLAQIPQLTYLIPSPHPDFDLKQYFMEYISYELDGPKRKALKRFLKEMSEIKLVSNENILSQAR